MEINEGKNVTEVLASVSEGSNEIGVVYATDAASVADKVDIIAEAPAGSLETPVLYPAGLIVDSEASDSESSDRWCNESIRRIWICTVQSRG